MATSRLGPSFLTPLWPMPSYRAQAQDIGGPCATSSEAVSNLCCHHLTATSTSVHCLAFAGNLDPVVTNANVAHFAAGAAATAVVVVLMLAATRALAPLARLRRLLSFSPVTVREQLLRRWPSRELACEPESNPAHTISVCRHKGPLSGIDMYAVSPRAGTASGPGAGYRSGPGRTFCGLLFCSL